MTSRDLVIVWRQRARELEPYAAPAATAYTKAADELEAALAATESNDLTIGQASDVTGYSPDHLGRMIRQGKLENIGEKHRPRLRRADVEQLSTSPRKRRADLPSNSVTGYDPRADARSLARRRNGGSHAA